jgi:hypothetical protein
MTRTNIKVHCPDTEHPRSRPGYAAFFEITIFAACTCNVRSYKVARTDFRNSGTEDVYLENQEYAGPGFACHKREGAEDELDGAAMGLICFHAGCRR